MLIIQVEISRGMVNQLGDILISNANLSAWIYHVEIKTYLARHIEKRFLKS